MTLTRIDDIQMAYTDLGTGDPVVLIHGYPFNRTMWSEQVAALSEQLSCHRTRLARLR